MSGWPPWRPIMAEDLRDAPGVDPRALHERLGEQPAEAVGEPLVHHDRVGLGGAGQGDRPDADDGLGAPDRGGRADDHALPGGVADQTPQLEGAGGAPPPRGTGPGTRQGWAARAAAAAARAR